jgi:tellurite resistance protein
MTVIPPPAATARQPEIAMAPGLAHLPLPLFAVPMGIDGLGLAWREAAAWLDAPPWVGEALMALGALAFALIAALHGLRAIRHPQALLTELRHPVRASFAGGATIGLMLQSTALQPHAPGVAEWLWVLAVALHLAVAVVLLRRILAGRGSPAMVAPPLLIPLVGNVLAPVIGAKLGFPVLSWMMLGLGMLLWLAVQPLLLQRLLAGPELPPALRPSVTILLAPPAVGSLAVAGLSGGMGNPASLALFGLAVVVAAVLLSLTRELSAAPFSLAWWSFTFPVSAFCIAVMDAAPVMSMSPVLPWLALAMTTGITGVVAARTLRAALAGTFLRPEG